MTGTLIVLVGALLVFAALLLLRGLVLTRSRGNLPCRLLVGAQGGWKSGVARYADGELRWIPLLGLGFRPRHAIARRGLSVSGRRPIDGGLWAIDCGGVSIAMSEDAITGFLSWLEAAPPSAHLDVA